LNAIIRTYTGVDFKPFEPHPDMVNIEDISQGLSNLCRYAGQSNQFYSVAQHSVFVSDILRVRGHEPEIQFLGLMHDSPEAYIVDLPTPIKMAMPYYQQTESGVWSCIVEKFGIKADEEAMKVMAEADNDAFCTEAVNFMKVPPHWSDRPNWNPIGITMKGMEPVAAKIHFMERFKYLEAKLR